MYIMNPICGCILSQHALEDCTIKFESNSFRILLSAVCRQSQSQKSEGTKLCQNFMSSKSTALLCICNRLQRKLKFALSLCQREACPGSRFLVLLVFWLLLIAHCVAA